ncbi:hypothetical protein PFRI_07930 [Planktotalea frisia]|uniref:Uncharacterized protein n=1 Tax=Planktotalea frisia TaxID=696762 RepID=A0A1L9P0A3_9RHOB|nr:hypothetical protein PFRI_07930 [Planktotalea frisia]
MGTKLDDRVLGHFTCVPVLFGRIVKVLEE